MSNQPLLLSLDDFINLLQNGNWKHEQSYQEPTEDYKENPEYDRNSRDPKEQERYITYFWGYGCVESILELGEGQIIEIMYQEAFSYNEDDPDGTWETTTDTPNGGWQWYIKGIKIVDEDGDEIEPMRLHNTIVKHADVEFWRIYYSEI
jgi:hypothetical protein